jgi:ABC-2 type transport system permease protein
MRLKKELNAIITIAYRDVTKFMRDRMRVLSTFIFPFIFVGVLGGSFQANLGAQVGFNYLTFIFTGVLAQTLFQSTAAGIISLIEDRENDFSQEVFVAPVSRYSLVLGKIVGESIVALLQGLGVVIFGIIMQVPMSFSQILTILPLLVIVCLFGGAFGVLVMSQLSSQRAANQVFPFLLFPQFFLSGVFGPIKTLPLPLFILSRIVPMTYAVDYVRSVFYLGMPEYSKVVLYSPLIDFSMITMLFIVFVTVGTFFFVRNEQSK